MPPSACFDVIGTCFAFDPVIHVISTRLGPSLSAASPPIDPRTLFFSWFYAAQRDFTYLSLASSYTPIASVLQHTFRRACHTVDIPQGSIADDDVAAVMSAFKSMPARPGLRTIFDGLRDAGWDVYAVTNGGVETSLRYFEKAGVGLDGGHLVSCDGIAVAKPDERVYENAMGYLDGRGLGRGKGEGGERWFVAAHEWDLVAARRAGFRTAWLAFEERVRCPELFGEFDLCAETMEELLEKMKAFN